jgi:hypothetical protein
MHAGKRTVQLDVLLRQLARGGTAPNLAGMRVLAGAPRVVAPAPSRAPLLPLGASAVLFSIGLVTRGAPPLVVRELWNGTVQHLHPHVRCVDLVVRPRVFNEERLLPLHSALSAVGVHNTHATRMAHELWDDLADTTPVVLRSRALFPTDTVVLTGAAPAVWPHGLGDRAVALTFTGVEQVVVCAAATVPVGAAPDLPEQ